MSRKFTYNNIVYSIISERFRTVRTGNNTNSSPNAVPSNFGPTLNIPEQVKDEQGKYYRVTEIGKYSFNYCLSITSVFVPSSVEIIRTFGLAQLRYCNTLTFGENSRLRIVESYGLYDFYLIESLVFTSNCLVSIDHHGIMFAFKLKSLIFPPSLNTINARALAGMQVIENIYYCGTNEPNADVFVRDADTQPQINSSVEIYVSSKYKGTTFGGRTIKGIDDSHCQPQTDICSDICLTMKKTQNYHFFLFSMIILIY